MIFIEESNPSIQRVWGIQTERNSQYRLLKYVIQANFSEYLLLHNCVTGELIALDDTEKTNLLNHVYDDAYRELIRRHFLVPVNYDEYSAIMGLRRILQALHKKDEISSYTILPTTNCNARCFYCYEEGFCKKNMDKETADQLIKYIAEHLGEKNRVHLDWFGGEPTICSEMIGYICNSLNTRGIEYYSSMTSNGFLFTEELVKQSKEKWKLKRIQISLDGTQEVYKKTKAYVSNPENPLKIVLQNIHLLSDAGIDVYIRLNLDLHNYSDLQQLACQLIREFEGNNHILIYVALLTESEEAKRIEHSMDEMQHIDNAKKEIEEVLRAHKLLYNHLKLPTLKLNACNADNTHSLLVTPVGILNKCENSFERNSVGDIYRGLTNINHLERWSEKVEYPCMKSCVLSPWCINLKMCPFSKMCSEELLENKIKGIQQSMLERLNSYLTKRNMSSTIK